MYLYINSRVVWDVHAYQPQGAILLKTTCCEVGTKGWPLGADIFDDRHPGFIAGNPTECPYYSEFCPFASFSHITTQCTSVLTPHRLADNGLRPPPRCPGQRLRHDQSRLRRRRNSQMLLPII